MDGWVEVLEKLKGVDIKTRAFLLEGNPIINKNKENDRQLIIDFPDDKKFHKEGAEKNREVIEKVIREVIGECKVEFRTESELIEDVKEMVGGEEIKADLGAIDASW